MRSLLLISADNGADFTLRCLGRAPRRDYAELADALEADVFDVGAAREAALLGHVMWFPARSALQALLAGPRLRNYDLVFSDNERLGAFVAMRLRFLRDRPRHVMLGHHLSPAKKRPFLALARPAIDKLVIHAEAQAAMARKLGFPGQSVVVLPYQVDTQFWRPPESDATVEPVISSAGLECRDYETLVAAVHGLSVRVEIGAASHWSRKRSRVSEQSAPGTVAVRSYDYPELRELYSRSRFVVAPLVETDFQAGITLILEAMAMAKAVVVSHTRGQRDVVRGPLWVGDGGDLWPAHGPSIEASNGLYVPPGDPISLRGAIKYLLNHPEVAEALGRNGRRLAETEYNLEAYVERLVAVLRAS